MPNSALRIAIPSINITYYYLPNETAISKVSVRPDGGGNGCPAQIPLALAAPLRAGSFLGKTSAALSPRALSGLCSVPRPHAGQAGQPPIRRRRCGGLGVRPIILVPQRTN